MQLIKIITGKLKIRKVKKLRQLISTADANVRSAAIIIERLTLSGNCTEKEAK